MRGSNIESIHKIHAVITDKKGRVLMCAGNPEYKTFIRSALKPGNPLLAAEHQKSVIIQNQLHLHAVHIADQDYIHGKPSKFYGNMTLTLII